MTEEIRGDGDPAYRWVVLVAVCPIVALVMGQMSNGLSVYFLPLEQSFGWARADVAMINSLGLVGLALGSILMGFIADHLNVRLVALFGVSVTGLCTLLASRADALWQLYGLFFLAGMFGAASISAPLMALVGAWFRRGVGLAIGLVAASQALGQGGMPFSGSFLITALGWREALAIQGFLTLGCLPLVYLLRRPPARAKGSPALSQQSPTGLPNGLVVGWLAAAATCCCITMSVPLMHLVPLLQSRGLAATEAGSVLFTMMVVAISGRVFFGYVCDRIGAIPTWLLTSAWQSSLVFGFTLVEGTGAFYAYAVVYGFGYAGVMTSVLVTVRHLVAPARLASSMGIITAFAFIGHGVGGWQGGYFFDLNGAYTWTYANAAMAGILNLLLLALLWSTVRGRRSPLAA